MSFAIAHPELVCALVVLTSFPYLRPKYRLRLAVIALGGMPWGDETCQAPHRIPSPLTVHPSCGAPNLDLRAIIADWRLGVA